MKLIRSLGLAAGQLVFIGSAACAHAMSAMPMADGGPYPAIVVFAFIGMIAAVIVCGYLLIDRIVRRRVERLMKAGDVEGLINALKNPLMACRAARALGEMRDVRAVEPLMEALHDRNSNVRTAAACALGEIGDPRSEGPLKMALYDEYRDVRECAGYALRKLHHS